MCARECACQWSACVGRGCRLTVAYRGECYNFYILSLLLLSIITLLISPQLLLLPTIATILLCAVRPFTATKDERATASNRGVGTFQSNHK